MGIGVAGQCRAINDEEMHKLFSLLDEIYALERLGLTALTKLTEVFKSAVRRLDFAEQASAESARCQ